MSRKTLILLVMCALIMCICIPVQAAQREFGQILGDEVNMRALPDKNSDAIMQLPVGVEVEVLEEKDSWYRIIYNGLTGYIRNDLVFVKSISDRIGYVLEDNINMRGGPSQSAYIVKKLTAGKPVRIKQMVGNWYYVLYEGELGFVHRDMVLLTKQTGTGYMLLKFDMEGQEVKKLQNELASRNFMDKTKVTGTYGAITRVAVQEFQKMANLSPADGVAGPDTLKLLYDPNNKIKKAVKVPIKPADFKGRVQMVDWWKGGSKVLKRSGGTATLTDVRTGKSFKIRRYAGSSHSDVTPMTANDTAIFKSIVGKWNWGRRAVWVTIGTKVYAGSINCMPHAPDHNKSDNFPGHICLHFKNSKTHGGNRVDPEHQRMIQYAYDKGK